LAVVLQAAGPLRAVALRLGVQLPGVQLRHPPLRVSGSRSRLASL
jgi:hypothetical protein